MTDEELAYLVSTKFSLLTDEARSALTTVIGTRDRRHFAEELRATRADLEEQAQHAEVELKKHETAQGVARRFIYAMSALFLAGGVVVGLLYDEKGYWLSAVGIGTFLVYWIKRLMWQLICAIFRMDYSK